MLQIHAGTPVSFEMEGQVYHLRFTLRVLKTLEHDHAVSVLRGPEGMMEAIRDPAKFSLLLYHGMKAQDPNVTLEWIEDNFDLSMLASLGPVIAQAISGKKPENEFPNAPEPGKVNGLGS